MLVRRFPYRAQLGLEQQLREMERLMSAMVASTGRRDQDEREESSGEEPLTLRSMNPAVDVYRKEDDLLIEIELPGVDIDNDVEIDLDGGMLTVRGQRSSERSEDRAGTYVTERRSGRFTRSLSLPDGVDPEAVEADYRDGVLTIRVPLPDEADTKPRQIEIGKPAKASSSKEVGSSAKKKSSTRKSSSKKSASRSSKSDEG